MRKIVVIAHNLRSVHNVGSLLRTAEGLGVDEVYLTGYTPYPKQRNDDRLPHMSQKIDSQIAKTALGAEKKLGKHVDNIDELVKSLRLQGFTITALEQNKHSIKLNEFTPPEKIAIILGREVEGLEPEILGLSDSIIEIPMFGSKESFNVVQAAGMAIYQIRFYK